MSTVDFVLYLLCSLAWLYGARGLLWCIAWLVTFGKFSYTQYEKIMNASTWWFVLPVWATYVAFLTLVYARVVVLH